MRFEFDLAKSRANAEKHGIAFKAVQALWVDPGLIDVPARTSDEERHLVVGLIDGLHWSAVITYRNERVRIISVRRARKEEIAAYESA